MSMETRRIARYLKTMLLKNLTREQRINKIQHGLPGRKWFNQQAYPKPSLRSRRFIVIVMWVFFSKSSFVSRYKEAEFVITNVCTCRDGWVRGDWGRPGWGRWGLKVSRWGRPKAGKQLQKTCYSLRRLLGKEGKLPPLLPPNTTKNWRSWTNMQCKDPLWMGTEPKCFLGLQWSKLRVPTELN